MDRNFPEGVDDLWRHGRCLPMAKALGDLLGWPIATLTVTLDPAHRDRLCTDHVVHAWVRSPDGRGFDAGGFFDEADLDGAFLRNSRRKFSDVRIDEFTDRAAYEGHLDRVYGTDPEWAEAAPFLEGLRVKAVEIARDRIVPLAEDGVALAPCP